MISFKSNKIVLQSIEPSTNPTSEELAKVVMSRVGLDPRKTGSTDKMYRTLLELYERAKFAYREKKPEEAVMTVEEMGMYAGITRQTMYDYLRRWLELNMIVKTSYIKDNKVIIGYKLNGATLEQSFDKAISRITKNLDDTKKYIQDLQKLIKNEKISKSQTKGQPSSEDAESSLIAEEGSEELPADKQQEQAASQEPEEARKEHEAPSEDKIHLSESAENTTEQPPEEGKQE